MLVLSRLENEGVTISVDGRFVKVCVVEIRGDKVRLGFEADKDVVIHRDEVWLAIEKTKNGELKNDDECDRGRAASCTLDRAGIS